MLLKTLPNKYALLKNIIDGHYRIDNIDFYSFLKKKVLIKILIFHE